MPSRAIAAVALLLAAALAGADEGQIQLKEGPGKEVVVAHCAMCHSLDYIPMNSPILDRKGWDGTVNKMIKAFGAPISAEDAAKIADYLAANYGLGAPVTAAPAPVTAAPARVPAAAAARAAEPPARTPELLAKGKASYATYCAACHGAAGAGDGPAAKALKPPPPDLTALQSGPPAVFAVLNTGVKGTAMVAFKHLPEPDRWAIAHYVDSLKKR